MIRWNTAMGDTISFHEFLKLCWCEGWTIARDYGSCKSIRGKHWFELYYCLLSGFRADNKYLWPLWECINGNKEQIFIKLSMVYMNSLPGVFWDQPRVSRSTLMELWQQHYILNRFWQNFSISLSIPSYHRWNQANDFILLTSKSCILVQPPMHIYREQWLIFLLELHLFIRSSQV